jgi:hypothetical protein
MIRRPASFASALLGIGLAAVFAAGCGSATVTASPTAAQTVRTTPTATATTTPTTTPAATPASSPSASESASPAVSPSPSPTPDLGLGHVNAALEDKLPGVIGGITLEKFSMPLSTYMASSAGGDKILYTPWLVKFGMNPDQIDLAVAADLTQTENFFVHAIQVPGVDAAALTGGFAAVARKAGWPVTPKSIAATSVLEIVDPATDAAGGLGTAYIYAKGDIMYVIVTDDASLLLEALIDLINLP